MAQQLLTADVLHALKLSKELSVPAAPKEQQGIIGDFVDATQQGAYQGIAGIGEMVGAEGLRDWALEGADAQQATMSDVGREAMAKPIFQEDASGSLELGAGATDARAIALQLGQMIGMNADILAGGGVVKGARMAVTQVAKFARKKMAEKGVPSAFIDDAVNAASTSYLGKLAGKSPEELKSLMTSAADFGVAAHAVSGGLAAIDLREETRAMDFDELENLPEFQTVVRELAETNPQASALDILGAARDALGEQAASAIKTNPALLASNFLVGGLGAATLQRLLKGTIPVGAGIAAEVAAEGTQGAIEQYASNQVRQDLINPDQQLSEGVLSSAANEAAMGGAMGITAAAVPASVSGAKALQQQWQQRQTGQREEQQAAVLPELGGGDELTGFEDPLPTPDAPVKTPAGLSGFYDMASKVSQEHPDFADKVVSLVAEDPKRADAAARVLQRYVQDESFRNTADARLNEFTSGVKPKPVSLAEDVPLSEIYSAQPDEMDDLFGSVEWTPEMDADSAPQVSQSPSPVTNAVLDAAPQNVKDAANFAMESFEANGQYPDDELLRDTFDLAPDQVAEIKKLYAPAQDLSTEAVGNSPDIPPMPSIDVVAHEAATSPFNDLPEPTPAQKEAGNYRKAHLDVQGLKIAIENPKGSVRSGTDAGGKDWSIEMKDHYGYIKRTTGADGDQVDVFIGDEPDSDRVFIVDQYKADGSFDEHKVVLGARTLDQAKATYSRNYAEGWPVGPVKELTMPEFKSWLGQGDTTVPAQPEAVPEGSDLIADFGPLRLEKYSEKSVVIRGDTKANSDLMKSLKGTFNPKLKGGGGWLFPATKADAVKQALSTAKLVAEPKQPTETEMSTLAKGETQTKAQQEAMTLLGAKAGEVIRTMGWGGVFQAGSMFTIEKVKPDGTVAMGVPGQKPSYFSLKDLQKAAKEGVIFEVQKPKQQPELLVSAAQQFEQHKQQLTGFADRVRGFNPEFSQRIEGMLPAAPDASYKPGAVIMELEKIKGQVELAEKRERLAKERKELEAEQLNKPIKGRKITAPAAAAEPAKVMPTYTPRHDWKDNPGAVQEYAEHLTQTGQLPADQVKPNGAWAEPNQLVSLIENIVRTNKDDVRTNSNETTAPLPAETHAKYNKGQVGVLPDKGEPSLTKSGRLTSRSPSFGPGEYESYKAPLVARWYLREAVKEAKENKDTAAEAKFNQALSKWEDRDFRFTKGGAPSEHLLAEADQYLFGDSSASVSVLDKAADAMSDKKREALAKLKKLTDERKGQLNSGVDPEVLLAVAEVGAFSIAEGAVKFAQWVRDVITSTRAFGIDDDSVKPFLKEAYGAMSANPEKYGISDEIADTMDTARDIRKMDVAALLTELEQNNDTESDQENQDGPGKLAQGSEPGAVQLNEDAQGTGAVPGQSDSGVRADSVRELEPDNGLLRDASDAGQGAVGEQRVSAGRKRSPQPSRRKDNGNYRIKSGELKRDGGWKSTAEQNVAIVELVQKITAENRPATPAEKATLVKFTGWGASEIANGVFPDRNGRFKPGWESLGARLKAALSAEQYAEARRTTQYAHYTSEAIINGIYKALGRLGFAGGSVLEPGAGVGHFAGLMPASMAENSQYTGIEYDTTSGTIAKLLYADSNIIVGDYTQTKLPKDFFDVAIGNPPFSSTTVLTDPEYRKQKFMLHDYFFAKTLDRVKPGGLLVFVTSKGTMDKANDRARSYLAKSADLLGAIRLPQTAFKENAGTEVVTDVIFLRKRLASEQSGGAAWLGLAEVSTAQGPALVNEYFAKNPAMVLGTHAKVGSMYRGDEYTVLPIEGDIEALITKAIKKLPQLVFKTERGSVAEAAAVRQRDYDPKIKKEGGIYVADDGTLMQVEDGQGVALTQRVGSTGKLIDLKPAEKEWLKGYTVVRDALKQAQYDQLNEGDWQTSLNALNQAYTGFVKKHGELQAYTASEKENDDGTVTVTRRFKNEILYRLDAEGALVHALEYVASDGKIEKGPVLKDRTLNKPAVVTITSTQDAMFVSLNERGSFDLPAIAKLAGKTEAEVISDLGDAIYQAPEGGWTTADDYLSGNVVRKLKEAKAAVRLNKAFDRNVKALEQVQPRQLTPQDITVQLGSHWVPASDVQSFAAEVLGEKMKVTFSALVNQWSVDGNGSRVSEWGIQGKNPYEILSAVLNNRQIKMTSKDAEGKTYTLIEPTEKANDIAKKMKAEFKRWIWADTNRSHRLVTYYNEHFNNIAPRTFDGQHLTLPGISSRFVIRPHQKRGVWRTIQQGDTYYAHSVGAGKTFTMIAAGMEERRLGLVKKPMYVVPNHMLAQFSKEFLELYPTAQIMVADEQNFHTHNRRKFVAQAALNDPDAIVITHSAFGRIGMSPEFSAGFISKQIDEWNDVLEEADKSDQLTVKQIEARIEKLENRLEALTSKEKKDQVLTFEELGVDRLYIDEGHEFRKLDFPTNRSGIKGIDPSGSQKAMDLYMKLEYLKGVNPGRSLVMASGTPITNTMGELFSIQRYFQGDQLEEDGLASFDGWSNHFGEVVEGLEQNAAGGYEAVSRFAKFVNVPELMSRVRSFMDVLTSQQLGDLVQRPNVVGGGRKIKVTPVPEGYKAYQKSLEERILAIRNRKGPPKPGDDIILSVISDGRFSAIDMRFVDPTLPSDPNSKLNVAIADMIQAYHSTADNQYSTNGKVDPDNGGALMLFTDIGLGEQSAANRGFNMKAWIEQELIAGGVKPEHIAFMRDHKTHAKKEKLFNDMRQGHKRILIGGKDMETGVNAQKRLTHLFHLDAPWFPASVEQREGRIIRQGNQNKEVYITAFATKGSYDSTMWGMNARKARFIEQAMSGDSAVRNMDDVSESSAFEMAAALASGDERYLKLAGLKGDIERLSRLYSAHLNDQRRLGSEKQSSENMLRLNTSTVEKIAAAIKRRTDIKPGSFTAMLGRKSFDNREDFSAAAFEEFKALAERYTDAVKVVGSIGGFDIKYHGVTLNGGNFVAELSVDLPTEPEPLAVFPIDPAMAVSGIATRAVNQVNGLERQLEKAQDHIQQYKTTLEKIQRRLGASFTEEAELNEKLEALAELEAELAAEKKEDESQVTEAAADSVVDIPAALGNGVGRDAVSGTPAHSQVGNGVELRIAEAVALAFDNSLMNPGAGTLVVKKFEDFPEDIQSLASPDAAAFYWQDKVYVNLQHIRDKADLQEVLVHERLRHGGLRLLFGRELWNELNRLATLIGPTKLRALANKYNVYVDGYMQAYADNNHPFPEAALLDEVIAHIKEPDLPKGLWAMLHRWAAKVVQKLRDWGFDALANKLNTPEHEMLFDLVRRAKARVVEGTPSAAKQKDFDTPMMLPKTGNAIADAVSQINADRLGRMAQLFKPAKIWQAMKVKWPDLRPAMLQLIPRNYLADIAGDLLPSLRRYNNQVASMEADRNHLLGITHETADKWRKLNGKNAKASIALADLMHEATLIGVDPSTSVFKPSITPQTYKVLIARAKEFIKARNGEAVAVARGMERMKRIKAAMDKVPEQDAAWHQLRQSYLALPAEYQQLFNEVRDSYKEMNDKRVEVLQKRIEDLIADKRVAAAQIRMMQEEFEVNELSGIYFPLQRFGKYRAAVKDTETNELIAFSMFDSNAEMQEWIRAKSAPGLSVVGGYEYEFSKLVDGVSMGFMKDLLDKFGMTFNRNNKIQDDLYQLFLEHNPSLSMRKHMIHRKGVAGFDQDALRAYAHNMFHSAYQISKTAHTHHMQAHILAMEDEANAITGTDDRVRAIQVVNELNQRNEWILNPKGSEWAQKLTGFGFFWYLGTTPAAALVNVTQTAMVGLPILGARYSYKAAGQALYDVSKAFMKGRGHVDKTLAGHELAAFRELERSGIIDKTMAHDMTGIADGGVAYSPRYHQVMKVSGFLFHHAERFNREVTAMASYRLAYAKKMQQYGAAGGLRAQQEAIQEAMDLTRLSHFDYANSNRPRFMQGDMARVLLLFRQHSVNMTYRLLRDFQQSFWGTGKDKEIARKQLAGMLGMTFLFAGAAGLPLYSLIAGIFNTLGGDEDEPFNFDDAVREVLAEALGETAASVVMNGVPGTMTGADLTNRIGMNNLWFRDADASLEGEAAVGYYAEQALGPMYGILTGWGRAVELARDGHTGKAWEAATPKFARDWFKAVRYATDGVQTKRGDPILDEVSPWQIALQANGFSPLEVSEQYQKNNALSSKVRAIRDRRQLLLNRWALGKRLGDYELEYETLAEIERFNQVNPTVAIRSSDRVRSMKQRERISQQAVNGVIISKKLNDLVN